MPHLSEVFVGLSLERHAQTLPVDDSFWQRLTSGQLPEVEKGYLVSFFAFDEDWDSWEVHPQGDEVVVLLSGEVTFVLGDVDGEGVTLKESGDFAVVPRGTWHTAKVTKPARMLFITAGEGTEHRPV